MAEELATNQRIIYVEPNDVYDKEANNAHGDLSLTPKYEDFCISFNLIIEQYARSKTDGIKDDVNGRVDDNGKPRTYSIQWGLTQEEMFRRRTSVLSGTNEGDNYNFLTTYYTDLGFDSYSKKTEIEGLGVESVQISYESWYTPTVTIKFIDVRGSAIFGREEAIHIDEHLMAENVFGAFFSMPYPLFRLQVKGFFGKPVTYQLTCSSFKGEFNSQTGNFEAVATFIGYSWSLLTDIPFAYLVAAPYATYIGQDYWEKKKTSKEWALWNDGDTGLIPPKLNDLFDKIATTIKTYKYGNPNEQQSEELSQIGNERGLINELNDKRSAFLRSLGEDIDQNYIQVFDNDTHNEQILLFHSSDKLELKQDTITKYEEFYNSLKQYEISDFNNGKTINVEKAPNKWTEDKDGLITIPHVITLLDKFVINTDENDYANNISVKELHNTNAEELQNIVFNDKDGKLSKTMSEELLNAIEKKNGKIKRYCYLIDMYNIQQQITDRINEMEDRVNKITKDINDEANIKIIDLLGGANNGGFKPFIGNVFKVIFCHLETFCHIMFDAADEIYAQQRTGRRLPSNLGITFEDTDIKSDTIGYVTPWPAIYNKGQATSECGYVSNAQIPNVMGWVGDLGKHLFVEEKVVYALQEGIQKIITDRENVNNDIKYAAFPILPSDYVNGGSVFSKVNIGNVSELGGHLANRIASVMGVFCGNNVSDEMATTFGKMDAYNLYTRMGSIVPFKNVMNDVTVDTIEGIMYCKDGESFKKYAYQMDESDPNSRRYRFENIRKIDNKFTNPLNKEQTKSRYPFFMDENGSDKSLYIHFYDKNYINYVPSTIKDFDLYKSNSDKVGENGDFLYIANKTSQTFKPNIIKSNVNNEELTQSCDWLHVCDTTKLDVLKEENVDILKYTNKQMFNIITDSGTIKGIRNKYSELIGGDIKIMEYEVKDDFSDFTKNFLNVSNYEHSYYFKNVSNMLSGNADALQLKKENFLSKNDGIAPVEYLWMWYENNADTSFENKVIVNDECDFLLNGNKTALSDLVIQSFNVVYRSDANTCCLFGCPFYYLQNDKINDTEKNDENFYNKRVLRSKAFLFLHTFKYKDVRMNVFKRDKKHGVVESAPKAYLLFLGALLWRKRFAKRNGYDPIVSKTINMLDKDNIEFYHNDVEHSFIDSTDKIFKIYKKNITNNPYIGLNGYFMNNEIDYNIENQLINLFENFVDNTFNQISTKYELRFGDKVTTAGDMVNFISSYLSKILRPGRYKNKEKEKYDGTIKTSDEFINWLKETKVEGLFGNYNAILLVNDIGIREQGLKMLLNEYNKEDQQLFKDLYFNPYIVTDNCHRILGKSNDSINDRDKIYVKKSLMQSYLKGFVAASNDIIGSQTINVGDDTNLNVSLNTFRNRDLSLAIYYYLKNLWDKWLCIAKTDAFDVPKFFDSNFVFIDSFYKNVYHYLAVNCEKLLSAWTELADNGSLFHFLSRIVSDHGCIFLPVPDYVGFNGETDDHDIRMMEDLFRPLPYNAIEEPSNNNKFIVMFTHSPSHVKTEQNNFRTDSYDIWTHEGKISSVAKELFSTKATMNEDAARSIATREGYNVPSFGIAFARQNNHIFKNLRLTMDNPVMTEQAIKAQWQIALKGGSSEAHSINFIGQDTFNVFSNYSYSITVDMMGNAQICPLMYFQLLNVPLWRGTYMIYKVVHNMTPGNMVTTITAMKMNKYAQPFNTSFFTVHYIPPSKEDANGTNSDCDDTNDIFGGTNPSISNDNNFKNSTIALVGDSYAVGMSKHFVDIANSNGLTAISKPFKGKGNGNIPENDKEHYSRSGAKTSDIFGARNAANDENGIIVIHLGLNSFSLSSNKIKMELEKVVSTANSHGAKSYLCIPICPPKIKTNNYNELVSGIRQAATSTKCGIIDLRSCQKQITSFDNENIHPVGNGYKILADKIVKNLISGGAIVNDLKSNNNSNSEILKKVLKNVNRARCEKYGWYTLKGPTDTYSDSGIKVTGQCTSGPTTWYANANINLTWWSPKSYADSNHSVTNQNFENAGFKMIWHGTKEEALKLKNSQFSPGDIVVLHAYKFKNSGPTSHGAMWTGYDWRSDFIQKNLWVYPNGVGRDGNYSVCIYRYQNF